MSDEFNKEVKDNLENFALRSRKYQSAFWSLVAFTSIGLILMYAGSQLHMVGMIQFGIAAQAGGILLGFYLARRGGEW